MKRFSLMHCSWAVVTIGAFVLGAFQSESPKTEKESSSQESSNEPGLPARFSGFPERNTTSSGEQSPRSRKIRETDGDRSLPLSPTEIDALVGDAIKLRSPVQRRVALDRILRGIQTSEISFEEALAIREAMKQLGAGEESKLLGYAIGENQADEAIAHLDKLPAEERAEFLKEIIPGLANESPEKAIGLFESLDPDQQAKVRPKFLEGLVDNDAAVATDYLYDSSDLENYHWRPMAELTRELVKDQGLQPTLDWADDLPQGPQRRDAWSSAYAVWASKDPIAAGDSINALPDGVDRNLAINGFVSAHVHQDGPLAMDWANSISNPGLREAAMIRIGKQFYQRDSESATQWYSSSGWSPTSWAKVTNSVEHK